MGRKSKLTEKKWMEIERRHIEGESIRSLAKEAGLTEAAVRKRIGARTKTVIEVSNQMVAAKKAFDILPVSLQISTQTRANKLMAMQADLDEAGANGARTAKRISQAVQNIVAEQIDVALIDNDNLKAMMAAGMVTNAHAKIAQDQLTLATKPNALQDPDKPNDHPSFDASKLSTSALKEIVAARNAIQQ